MTFGLAGPWDDADEFSASKANFMTVPSGSGDDIAGLDKTKFKIVVCTADGSGLLKDHVYCADAAGENWIDLTLQAAHTHTGTNDGGAIDDIFRANPTFIDTGFFFMEKNGGLKKAAWTETVSSTGSTADDTTSNEDSMKLATGATSGSGATLSKTMNWKLDFSKPSHFQFMLKMSATTALALKAGINCETATASDDNTAKYEAQLCTVTNANWNLRTASGSNKSESDLGTAFTTSQTSIRLEHFPTLSTPKVDMYLDSAVAFTKTSDIPTSGSAGQTNIMKFSLKNSAAADKQCFIYGCRLRFYTSSSWL
jgi:hypothetical protein